MGGFGWFADGAGFMVGAGKGVGCLRAVPEADMIKASRAYYATLQAPHIGLGVVIDGNLVPDFPPYLVAQGHFHKNITILVSNDDNEVYMPSPMSARLLHILTTSTTGRILRQRQQHPPHRPAGQWDVPHLLRLRPQHTNVLLPPSQRHHTLQNRINALLENRRRHLLQRAPVHLVDSAPGQDLQCGFRRGP